VTDMHDTMSGGNFPLTQKQLTSVTLVQFESPMAVSKHCVTQLETPLKLGYSAELVELALVDEELLALDVGVAVTLPVEDAELDGIETGPGS